MDTSCPLIQLAKNVGENREIECVNCPLKTCWDDHPQTPTKRKLFISDIEDRITELQRILGIFANMRIE